MLQLFEFKYSFTIQDVSWESYSFKKGLKFFNVSKIVHMLITTLYFKYLEFYDYFTKTFKEYLWWPTFRCSLKLRIKSCNISCRMTCIFFLGVYLLKYIPLVHILIQLKISFDLEPAAESQCASKRFAGFRWWIYS